MNNSELTYLQENGYHVVKPQRLFGRDSELHSGDVTTEGGYREVTAEEMFGTYSERGNGGDYIAFNESLTDTPVYQSLVLVTLIAYLAIMLRSWGFIRSIWIDIFKTDSDQLMAFEGGELPLQRFKLATSLLGLGVVALAVVRLTEMTMTPEATIEASIWTPLMSLGALIVTVIWNYLFHLSAGWVTQSDSLTALSRIGLTNFVRMIVVLYPIAAVWLLADIGHGIISGTVLSICGSVLLLLYLKDTFVFFLGKKISIFYWILYLCTAILLPASLIVKIIAELTSV